MSKSKRSSRRSRSRSRRGGAALPAAMPPSAPTSIAKPAVTNLLKAVAPSAPPALAKAAAAKAVDAVKKGGSRRRRGGDGAGDWVLKNFGTENQQYENTFGNSGTSQQGNLLPTLPNAPAVVQGTFAQSSISPNAANVMKGGKRRSKRGGYWAQVLNQALVPFGLIGLQQQFSKRMRSRGSNNKTKKH